MTFSAISSGRVTKVQPFNNKLHNSPKRVMYGDSSLQEIVVYGEVYVGQRLLVRRLSSIPIYCAVVLNGGRHRILLDSRSQILWRAYRRVRDNKLELVWEGTLPAGKDALDLVVSEELREQMGKGSSSPGVMQFRREGKWRNYTGDPCPVFII